MNKTILAMVTMVGIALGFYFLQYRGASPDVGNRAIQAEPSSEQPEINANQNSLAGRIHSELTDQSTTFKEPIDLSAESAVELQEALELAIQEREEAEQAMRVIEMKVSALEAQLDDIETRGDNPADVQDETLDTFLAVFAEYQDMIAVYDKAAAREEWLEAKVKQAGL